ERGAFRAGADAQRPRREVHAQNLSANTSGMKAPPVPDKLPEPAALFDRRRGIIHKGVAFSIRMLYNLDNNMGYCGIPRQKNEGGRKT
ncbi:MAG: hypothetical protein IJU66_01525, partial [Oscillospiraceae bacterium]|nr:hypothetical protein [Oscillospiraceae bacterium]